jgi:hypothetical protein
MPKGGDVIVRIVVEDYAVPALLRVAVCQGVESSIVVRGS